MEMKNKHVFWEALIVAVLIFASGIFVGYLLEMNRTNKIISLYQDSELNLLDIRTQSDLLSFNNLDCDKAINQTIAFADRVYVEALSLERYENSNKLTQSLVFQHKRYDILRAILWIDAIKLKERCGEKFNTLVYFYEYQSQDIDKKSMQTAFANKLGEVKAEFGDKVILIPMAGNLGVNSIAYLMSVYNVTSTPSVLINEKTQVNTLEELKNIGSEIK